MAGPPKSLPRFASEEDELRFWDEHDPSEYVEGPSDVIVRLKRQAKRPVTIRLDEPLYDELRSVAARHGLPYQRLMRELLRQSLAALAAEEKRVVRSGDSHGA
jgi:predicted DNA binding CopG/RHH family protein